MEKSNETQNKAENKTDFCQIAYLHEMVILPSFHRCGNTLTRELLEGITNVLTGSDDMHFFHGNEVKLDKLPKPPTKPFGPVNLKDTKLKFKAQWVVDQRIWVYKTHYPARKGKGTYEFDKILLITRNPFDALDSMFNLYLTNSHNKSIKKEEYQRLFQCWEELVKAELAIWNKFYTYWVQLAETEGLNILIIRYEDLITGTKSEILKIFKFILNYQILEDTIVEKFADEYLVNRKLLYKPRKGTNFHSLENYTEEQRIFILENSVQMFKFFKYDKIFADMIKEYKIEEVYSSSISDSYEEINRKTLNRTSKEEKYPYDYIHIPMRESNPYSIDSEINMLKFSKNNKSGTARLSYEISKIVKIEEEDKDISS